MSCRFTDEEIREELRRTDDPDHAAFLEELLRSRN